MSRFSHNVNTLLVAGLLGGILLAGLGSGMAFAEYIEFDYLPIEEEENASAYVTEQFTYTMSPEEIVAIPSADSISFDDSISAGTILITVEYNPQTIATEFIAHAGGATNETIIETPSYYIANDFEQFMSNKDAILQGLKEGKIISVQTDHYFTATAIANPADQNRISHYPGSIKVVG